MFSDWWEFLNSPAPTTWMHTLFGGLVAALISAGVALLVLLITVKAQNKGIRRQIKVQQESLREQLEVQERGVQAQLEAQERSVAEQLRVQRNENNRNREHAAAVRFVEGIRAWLKTGESDFKQHENQAWEHFEGNALRQVKASLEELRLNLDSDDDRVIDAFRLFIDKAKWMMLHQMTSRTDLEQPAGVSMHVVADFLSRQIIKYVRSSTSERLAMQSVLVDAGNELGMPMSEWVGKYMNGYYERWWDGSFDSKVE